MESNSPGRGESPSDGTNGRSRSIVTRDRIRIAGAVVLAAGTLGALGSRFLVQGGYEFSLWGLLFLATFTVAMTSLALGSVSSSYTHPGTASEIEQGLVASIVCTGWALQEMGVLYLATGDGNQILTPLVAVLAAHEFVKWSRDGPRWRFWWALGLGFTSVGSWVLPAFEVSTPLAISMLSTMAVFLGSLTIATLTVVEHDVFGELFGNDDQPASVS